MKEHKKLDQKQVSKVTLHFVWGHLSRKQTVGGFSGHSGNLNFTNYLLVALLSAVDFPSPVFPLV